jgi:BirA family biotin operon repressor/biotin-[acetyl-CoA-carboxylase] ligase
MEPPKQIIGRKILKIEEVDSTNRYALSMLEKELLTEGIVIVAGNQFAGKGQEQNIWESEVNMNLTFSIILYPTCITAENQFLLNKVIALGLFDFTTRFINMSAVHIKWPNDLYIGDRKVAGILINNAIIGNTFLYAVAGIGYNINQIHFRGDAPNPVSLKMISGQHHDLNDCLELLCNDLNKRYLQLINGELEKLDGDYLNHLYRFGRFHPYRYHEMHIQAKITGVDEFGRLILVSSDGQELTCHQKEIEFIFDGG